MCVVGLDQYGDVLIEENDMIHHTGEKPAEFIEWYGINNISAEEKILIGLVIH